MMMSGSNFSMVSTNFSSISFSFAKDMTSGSNFLIGFETKTAVFLPSCAGKNDKLIIAMGFFLGSGIPSPTFSMSRLKNLRGEF